jgi:integrase
VDDRTLAHFAKWLSRFYADSSVRKIRTDVATMANSGVEPPESKRLGPRKQDFRWAWSRFDQWCIETGRDNELPEPPAAIKVPGRAPKRLKPALSIPEGPWKQLRQRVRADDSVPGCVLDVLVCTGLRIGDVLRVDEPTIRTAFTREDGAAVLELKGSKPVIVSVRGAPKAWERLLGVLERDQRVCDAVSPGSSWSGTSAAYQRVRRALKAHATAVGLDERLVHLHRLRRTIGVTLIRAGASLEEVQRVLGHNRRMTTETYLDEQMSDVATRALQRINR